MNTPDPSSTEVLRLVALLRNQDQLIFKMSQCGSWAEMRPHFQVLLAGTMARMHEESDRICMLMIPEIRKVYANATVSETTSAEPERPRLEGPGDAGNEEGQKRQDD